MKSSYEIAMEKLNQQGPPRPLSDAEKTEMAEIDKKYDAQIAELNLAHDAKVGGLNPMEILILEQDLVGAVQPLEKKRDAEKDAIWERESE